MVLQVFTHARQVFDHRDAVLRQQGCRADTGKLQQLWRVDRAAAQNHLDPGLGGFALAVLDILNADGLLAFEQDSGGQGPGLDSEILATHGGMQIGHRRRAALTVLHGELVVANPLLFGAVNVGIARNAGFDTRLHHGVGDFMGVPDVGYVERAVHGMVVAGSPFLVLGAQEIGTNIVPAPPFAAELAPAVIVGVLATHIQHGVDRG